VGGSRGQETPCGISAKGTGTVSGWMEERGGRKAKFEATVRRESEIAAGKRVEKTETRTEGELQAWKT